MNRRTLKKHCRRAAAALQRDHGYRASDFTPATGHETLDAPAGMERRFVRREWLEPGALPGTPLLWRRTSHEYDEWEPELPSVVLADVEFWNGLSEEAAAAFLAPAA